MKTLMRKRSFAAAAVGGLASVGLLGAPAMAATPANPGHQDIVNVSCVSGTYTYTTNINGVPGTPASLANFEFDFPATPGEVFYDSGNDQWVVDEVDDDVLPDVGFNYSVSGSGCEPTIYVDITNAEVQFNGESTVELDANQHVHGAWTFAETTGNPWAGSVGFVVDNGTTLTPYGAADFTVG